MKSRKIYVALSQFCENDERPRKVLQEAGFIVEENKTGRRIKREEMLDALKEADAVLAAVEPYDAELLAQLPKLQCISRCGVGTDAIDLEVAKKYEKTVLVTADEIIEPVAQMTLAMILALARNFSLHAHDFKEALWKKHTGWLLSEWTIGLIGFGKIGRKVEEYLRPFGVCVLVCDPYLNKEKIPKGVTLCDLPTLLGKSDLVSLHLARDSKEGYLITAREFAQMKKGSFFVNTARGYMVEEMALQAALKSGHLAGAALDVFEQEPYPGPLTKYSNVILTPHIATLTRASRTAMELGCAQNVVFFFKQIGEKDGL
ncbi:MAG: hypothetical protein A2W61_06320 [Deltaproteobacteria bacterium RIFCSPLOWO2_01_44_7]|nr:MAG: hypothetical protein A2712_02820 [Deltaproteobacteria bacterium RIFCSPHIGHO2_01_FULL_43_49]OGQ16128.1 MAG: hypothetical protein A3D22_00790 [Deltaproteobacteria bacterium RIFCSPHIGHO2_02_FULL_44_53]OGQ29089.1 MAG: hypothetical protein A3D98_04575 [Deltaproteobacteria bacterium RIFCSPHIGHO2_12_FULL_44_21]OGQ32645.1 MAG: hypothetical protein A2979_08720 [Deltaproteobacteria bacterium RIFCSPLOWO2_01_FULL_45_74]OGQ38031.1 MAG: hypothetical protein A2W61_06320 [Deltaproteobacteria bacterium 